MPQTIADTVKALTEFEAELDRVKTEAMEAKKKLIKDSADWAEAAKNSATAEAQKLASGRLSQARMEAEAEAEEIRTKGQAETKKFAESISRHKKEASELVLRRLLGEGL
jgi:vacuolar-type H+-ATPase subunit H